jgi:hypothetical protein
VGPAPGAKAYTISQGGPECVPVTQFPFDELDSAQDHLREAILRGDPVAPVLQSLIAQQYENDLAETLSLILSLIIDARRPGLVADQLSWAAGLPLTHGLSSSALARRRRVSKQAFCQGALKFRRILRLRKTVAMRTDRARANMAAAYRARAGDRRAKHPHRRGRRSK